MAADRARSLPFKPRARLLLLLGNELIRDPDIAVFELVKNAYDADASKVSVTMFNVAEKPQARIVIEDDGSGMDWATVTEEWLEPGTDFRIRQRQDGAPTRTPRYNRLPLGEKGVGRFAVHKLGGSICMVTRAKNRREIVVEFDWGLFDRKRYLTEAKVRVTEREPAVFAGSHTGTRIEVTDVRDNWTRGMVRDVHRAITSICSPFAGPGNFEPILRLEPDYGWLEGLLDASRVMDTALFHAAGRIHGNQLDYKYRFTPLPAMDRVQARSEERKAVALKAVPGSDRSGSGPPDLSRHQIGDVKFELHVFDREPQILALGVADRKGLKEFLDQNGGIRVYRDGIRVYDYGEQGNDWLDLGGRRVNIPTRRLSNNIVIGAVSLRLADSADLMEKTNREGFVENEAFREFRDAVLSAVQDVTLERNVDKARIRKAYKKASVPFTDAIDDLRENLQRRDLLDELGSCVDSIERDFLNIRDRLLTAAGAGLSLAMVIHEVEKGIGELNKAVERDVSLPRVRELAKHLSELITGLTYLTRRSGQRREEASNLVRQALFNTEYRLSHYGIEVTNGFEDRRGDFAIRCRRRLIIATLMNLIDNAIYWLDVKGSKQKRLFVGPSRDLRGGPAIVIADNGPGFMDPPEYLIEPFMSRKPDGMGLGLHLASEVMKAHDGRVEFPQKGDVKLPDALTGAVVALVFKGESR